MSKARFIAQSSRSCFRMWRSAPRTLTLLAMITILTIIYALPFAENASVQGKSLQCTEIFIAIMNWRFTMLLFSSAILLLLGNLPVVEQFTVPTLLHGTRRSWLASQMLYIVAVSLILPAFVFIVTVLVSLPNLNFLDAWSRPVKLLAMSGRIAIPAERMRLMLSKYIITNYLPWQAFGYSFSLFFLMSCIYGLASLVLNIRYRSGGLVLLLIINALSWASNMFAPDMTGFSILSTLSLHYNATLDLHQLCTMNALLPSVGTSYAILACLVVLLAMLAMFFVKHYDFVTTEGNQ